MKRGKEHLLEKAQEGTEKSIRLKGEKKKVSKVKREQQKKRRKINSLSI